MVLLWNFIMWYGNLSSYGAKEDSCSFKGGLGWEWGDDEHTLEKKTYVYTRNCHIHMRRNIEPFLNFFILKFCSGFLCFQNFLKKHSSFIFLELQYLCRLTPLLNCSHSIHSRHSWYFDLFLAKLGRKYLNHCMEILIQT